MDKISAELRLIGCTIVAFSLFAGHLSAGEANWVAGPALQRQLAEPVDIYWLNNPLRRAFDGISQARKIAILIDRRVDPGRELSVSLNGMPLESAMQQIAAEIGLELSRLGDVLYLGPAGSADRLEAVKTDLTASIRRMPKETQRKLLLRKAIAWDDLAEPRELVEQLARENGLEIEGLNRMPHDLWAAANLPPLTLADRLTLIAFQFDLAFKPDAAGKRLEVVPLATEAAPRPKRKTEADATPERPSTDPPANLERLRIDRMVVREKPLGAILDHLAKRLDLDLRIDREAVAAAGISLDQLVSLTVENATIDELFTKLLADTRLTFRRVGRVVTIAPEK